MFMPMAQNLYTLKKSGMLQSVLRMVIRLMQGNAFLFVWFGNTIEYG